MFNSPKLCPTHFSKEAKKVSVGLLPPSYGPAAKTRPVTRMGYQWGEVLSDSGPNYLNYVQYF